jgi:coproporphyrinogen III oxidase-like Fe-S oxidoreductase
LVLYEVTYINKDNQRLRKYYYCDFNDAFPVHDKVASYWDRLFDNTKHKSQCLVRLNKDGVVYCVRPS